jgi:hypothetical protein
MAANNALHPTRRVVTAATGARAASSAAQEVKWTVMQDVQWSALRYLMPRGQFLFIACMRAEV